MEWFRGCGLDMFVYLCLLVSGLKAIVSNSLLFNVCFSFVVFVFVIVVFAFVVVTHTRT